MNQEEIGALIARRRKEEKLTQAQLAEKLNITDRAVSKWETGKSMPDVSILGELCEILHLTVDELLRGEKKAEEKPQPSKRKKARSGIPSLLFSATLFVGALVCVICDLAISGGFTWSPIPVSAIAFTWAVFFPAIQWGKSGVMASLLSLSIFIFPFLYLLGRLLKEKAVFTIGAAMAAISVAFMWLIFAAIRRLWKKSKPAALGVSFLLAGLLELMLNNTLAKMIGLPAMDVWDVFSVFLLLLLAFGSFLWGAVKRK